jgi:uncharacterized membrane protein
MKIRSILLSLFIIFSGCRTEKTPQNDGSGTPQEFRAAGEEPFWSLKISQGGIEFNEMGKQQAMIFDYQLPRQDNDGYHYRASRPDAGKDTEIQITIKRQRCYDEMAGTPFDYTAVVLLQGVEYRGCAALKQEPEQIVARFIEYANSSDFDGIQSLFLPETDYDAAAVLSTTSYEISAKKEVSGQVPGNDEAREGDLKLEVRQNTTAGDILVSYWLRNIIGIWRIYAVERTDSKDVEQ